MKDIPNSLDKMSESADWTYERIATAVEGVFDENENLFLGVPNLPFHE